MRLVFIGRPVGEEEKGSNAGSRLGRRGAAVAGSVACLIAASRTSVSAIDLIGSVDTKQSLLALVEWFSCCLIG